MIVATAGHVDHGKTLLIRALTGVDTDRLPEERARGMTIDLGFAYLPLPAADGAAAPVLGFIDVPGHERFVRNMLAGVAGIDFALLVVAADDGPMPQTREHLAILDLLGIARGAVALTKTDRVDGARVAAVAAELRALLAPTALAAIPIVPTCAPRGEGIDTLQELLRGAQAALGARASEGGFRLAIDRSFVLEGAGRVVTGTVYSGTAAPGDALVIAPGGTGVRVRGIHAQNRVAERARAGERCGINLAGLDLRRHEIHRGDWLVCPALADGAKRLGVELRLATQEAAILRDRTPVHLHLGAADLGARVTLLRSGGLAPGDTCHAILTLDAPVIAVRGDRFVLRDQSATRTLGGGVVLEAVPYPRELTRARRLPLLAALAQPTAAAALVALQEVLPEGIDRDWLLRCWNLPAPAAETLFADAGLASIALPRGATLLVDAARWTTLADSVVAGIAAHHAAAPAEAGLPEAQVAAHFAAIGAPRLLRAALDARVRDGALQRRAGFLCLPTHTATLAGRDAETLARVSAELARHGLQAPAVHDMLVPLKLSIEFLKPFLERMHRFGHLRQVGKSRYYLPATLTVLATQAEALAATTAVGRFTAQEYRQHTGIGRNVTIEVLEYFDRVGFTQRIGEARRIRRPVAEVFGA